jgi:ribosome maturation protein Sdo1
LSQGLQTVKKFSKIEKEDYDEKGCTMTISMIPGDYENFLIALNNFTKGDFDFNTGSTIKEDDIDNSNQNSSKNKKKNKKN